MDGPPYRWLSGTIGTELYMTIRFVSSTPSGHGEPYFQQGVRGEWICFITINPFNPFFTFLLYANPVMLLRICVNIYLCQLSSHRRAEVGCNLVQLMTFQNA